MNTNTHSQLHGSRPGSAASIRRRWSRVFVLGFLSLSLAISGSGCKTIKGWFSKDSSGKSEPVMPEVVTNTPPVAKPEPAPEIKAETTPAATQEVSTNATPNLLKRWWTACTKLFSKSEQKPAMPAEAFDEADMTALANVLTNAQAASLAETQTNAPAVTNIPAFTITAVATNTEPVTNTPAVKPPSPQPVKTTPANTYVTPLPPPKASPEPATPTTAAPATNAPAVALMPGDRLNEGDVIQFSFPGASNMNAVVKIPADGIIRLPFTTNIQAAGLTLEQLRETVLNNYESQLQLREVTITVVSSSAAIYVSGAVLRPGRIAISRPMTALEAVMEAGGFDPNRAKPSKVTVIRYEGGKQMTYKLDLQKALEGKPGQPFMLKPFDILYVPSKTFNF